MNLVVHHPGEFQAEVRDIACSTCRAAGRLLTATIANVVQAADVFAWCKRISFFWTVKSSSVFVCPALSCFSTMCSTMHPTLARVQRLDTRFRELQRRGNEIAGDSSRPEFRQVGMRGEKDCLSRSTGRQLRRPMKEIDASEYLRELETFHAEQDCFSIVNSNLPHLSDISCIDLYWASGTVCRAGQGDPQI